MNRRSTLTLADYRTLMAAGKLRKALCTELGRVTIVWFDFGRGPSHRTPFVRTDR